MTQRDVAKLLNARFLEASEDYDREAVNFCGADMMSEALAFSHENTTLLTGLCNQQVIRTAEMLDVHAIIFVRGKQPTPEMLEMAKEKDIVVMSTCETMYNACGKIYHAIHKGE